MAFPLLALVTLATTALTAGASFKQSQRQGDALRREAETAAKQEELAATQREADRKAKLGEAMASQNAAAGAKNIKAFEGSPLTILQEDIRREEVATERDKFGSQLSNLSGRIRARTQAGSVKSQAAISLLSKAPAMIESGGNIAGGFQVRK